MRCLMVPGAGLTLSEQLGLSNKADRISGIGGIGNQPVSTRTGQPILAVAVAG